MKVLFIRGRVVGGRGFTLIELLVVIALIATLAAVSVPITLRMLSNARTTEGVSMGRELVGALEAHRIDYGYFPHPDTPDATDSSWSEGDVGNAELVVLTSNRGRFLQSLMGEWTTGNAENEKGKVYLEMQDAKDNERGGLVRWPNGRVHGVRDPWGNGFDAFINYHYDGSVLVGRYGETVQKDVAVVSRGADGQSGYLNEELNQDDVKSWR